MRTLSFFAASLFCGALSAPAADPFISEFMADNAGYLADEDGQFMDWIEVFNPGPASVNLLNWSLTDESGNLTKWKFPSHTLSAGQAVFVWASGKDRAIAGSQLHANFSMNDAGEYLALVKPNGVTKTSEWNPYPVQKENVSWGSAQQLVTTQLVNTVTGKSYVQAAAPPANWNTVAYVPNAPWTDTLTPPGLGYDTTVAVAPASNIAPGGTAVQSTTFSTNAAALANDSLTNNFSQTLNTDTLPFWDVDFGTDASISRVTVRNRPSTAQSRLRDITITVLNASLTPVWTSALLNPENAGFTYPAGPATLTVDIVALNGSAVTGRHVRVSRTPDPDLSGTGGQGTIDEQNVLGMSEVEVLGYAPDLLLNLARTGSPAPDLV